MCPNRAAGMSSKCPEELDQWVNALSLLLAVHNDGGVVIVTSPAGVRETSFGSAQVWSFVCEA